MTTLIIQDLAKTAELDRSAMSSVRGGMGMQQGAYKGMYEGMYPGIPSSFSSSDFSFDAKQLLAQDQNTVVNNGNNVAFASGISAHVNPHQNGTNTINFA